MKQEIPPVMLSAYIAPRSQYAVWCAYCGCLHFHGAAPGGRCAHCQINSSPYKDGSFPDYYLVPTGQPLPADAMKLHRQGMAKVRRHWYRKHYKPYEPLPVPEWGRPLYQRDHCEALMMAWAHEQGLTPDEAEDTKRYFNRSWDEYAAVWQGTTEARI